VIADALAAELGPATVAAVLIVVALIVAVLIRRLDD